MSVAVSWISTSMIHQLVSSFPPKVKNRIEKHHKRAYYKRWKSHVLNNYRFIALWTLLFVRVHRSFVSRRLCQTIDEVIWSTSGKVGFVGCWGQVLTTYCLWERKRSSKPLVDTHIVSIGNLSFSGSVCKMADKIGNHQ